MTNLTRAITRPLTKAITQAGAGGQSLTAQVQALFAKYSADGGMWDFTDMATLFQDSAGTTPVTAASQPVGRVSDLSGNGKPFLMATSSRRPTWASNRLETDRVDDGMFTDAVDFSVAAGYTIGVRMAADVSTSQYDPVILCDRNGWLSPNNSFGIFYDGDSTRFSAFNRRQIGGVDRLFPQAKEVTPEMTLVSSGKASFSGVLDGIGFWKNGVAGGDGSDNSGTGTLPNVPITIGSDIGGNYFSKIRYAKAFVIAAEISIGDRDVLEAWLAEVAP